jgi:hypothetical protein
MTARPYCYGYAPHPLLCHKHGKRFIEGRIVLDIDFLVRQFMKQQFDPEIHIVPFYITTPTAP